MTESPETRVQALHEEAERFKAYLSQIPAAALKKPSACAGWTIGDVMGHLSSQAFAERVKQGLRGNSEPPPGAPPVSEHDEDKFALAIFQRSLDANKNLGDQLIPTLVERLNEVIQTFQEVGPDQWDALCYWPPGPEPVRTMLDMRLAELAMHVWDIRSRLDDDYHLADASVAGLMAATDRAVRRAFRPDTSVTKPIRHRFSISQPVAANADIVISAEGGRLETGDDSSPADVTFSGDGETYVLVMYGRLTLADAIAEGRVNVSGDQQLAAEFGRRFQGG
jgi:uncharacterized protein (TIGR03083 family)